MVTPVLAQCSAHGRALPGDAAPRRGDGGSSLTRRPGRSPPVSPSSCTESMIRTVVEGAAIVALHEARRARRVAARRRSRDTTRPTSSTTRRRFLTPSTTSSRENCALEEEHPELRDEHSVSRHSRGRDLDHVLASRARRADAEPRQRLWRRGAAPVEQRVTKGLGADPETIDFSVEPKIDGLALSIAYVDGELVQSSDPRRRSRGRGRHGERSHHRERAESLTGAPGASRCEARSFSPARTFWR